MSNAVDDVSAASGATQSQRVTSRAGIGVPQGLVGLLVRLGHDWAAVPAPPMQVLREAGATGLEPALGAPSRSEVDQGHGFVGITVGVGPPRGVPNAGGTFS